MRPEIVSLLPLLAGVIALIWLVLVAPPILVQTLLRRTLARGVDEEPTDRLTEGPARIVGVAVAVDADPIATLTIDQVGSRLRRKHHRYTVWTETGRRIATRPFFIVTPAGRVAVDTTKMAIRTEEIARAVPDRDLVRRCTATIRPGEHVSATGCLVREAGFGGYRGAERWTLQPDDVTIAAFFGPRPWWKADEWSPEESGWPT